MADKNDITSKKARAKLAVQNTIYWKTLKPGKLHLGYAKRKAGVAGTWIMRTYFGTEITGTASPYQKQNLGIADDFASNDRLSFIQAQQKAFELHVVREKQKKAGIKAGPLTVSDLAADYLVHLKAEGQKVSDAQRRIDTHIKPALGSKRVEDLTTHQLIKWRDAMAAKPAQLRTAKGKAQRFRDAPVTPEEKRARRATVNRTVTVLKAMLNRAFKSGRLHDDTAWRRLEPFAKVDARRPGFLTVEQSQRLINAAPSGFRDLVHGALLTGARYSELCRLKVSDFQNGRIAVHTSKSGKGRDIRLTAEGRVFFAQLTAGRKSDEWLFRRADGQPWGDSHQARPMKAACEAAKIIPVISFHELRHTYASLAIMNGTPIMVVAENLGHSDSRMCERHYGHLTSSFSDAAIEAGAPSFGIVRESNVVAFK